jgi:tetratricopeptide (TPR) repeat protein
LSKTNDPARQSLVAEYYSRQAYSAVVALYNDVGVTDSTDSLTLIQIANSLQRAGEAPKAISLLETTLESRTQDAPLYLALADMYKIQGNLTKAAELKKQALAYTGASHK